VTFSVYFSVSSAISSSRQCASWDVEYNSCFCPVVSSPTTAPQWDSPGL